MNIEKAVVGRDNISPLAAKIVQSYFVDRCNDMARPKGIFAAAEGAYDESAGIMTVRAEVHAATDLAAGQIAVERAFQFAKDMDSL